MRSKNGMILCSFIAGMCVFSLCFAQEKGYDFEIKKGLEIIGAEERPRVIFFLPELKLPLRETILDAQYLLRTENLEQDMEILLKEDKE